MTTPVSTPPAAALSRELADFLIELSIAMHKHAIYPSGHPQLASAEERVAKRVRELLQERETLAIGVARQQLVIEGVATDPGNPLLRELAQRLHRHYIGAIRFYRGVDEAQLASMLQLLGTDSGRTDKPLGLGAPDTLARWSEIRLYPLTYGSLELVEDSGSDPTEEPDRQSQDAKTRSAQLWIGLARAALVADPEAEASGEAPPSTDPVVVARAIDERSREVAYDQVIVGYLLQIADTLKADQMADSGVLRRRVSRMVGALKPETLRRLLDMGGNRSQRRRFVLDAAQGMAVDAVVELLKTAAEMSEQSISHSLVRMLSKMALHAEQGGVNTRGKADIELREAVTRLISGWELEDPNPEAYRAVLEGMGRTREPTSPDRPESDNVCEPERVVAMAVELGAAGRTVRVAVDELAARGRLGSVLDFIDQVPATNPAARAIWDWMRDEAQLDAILTAPQVDFAVLARIAARWETRIAPALIRALEISEDRTTRRRLLDLLVELGPAVAPAVIARLNGTPWYVQRNMLVILSRLESLPAGFTAMAYLSHEDARVRREATRLMLRLEHQREQALYTALADRDSGVLHLALTAVLEQCPPGAVLLIKNRVADRQLDPELRALGIRAIAGVRGRDTVGWLLSHALAGRTLFRRPKLAPKSPVMLAALAGLATHWRDDPRALPALRAAFDSSDSEIGAVLVSTGRGVPTPSGGTPVRRPTPTASQGGPRGTPRSTETSRSTPTPRATPTPTSRPTPRTTPSARPKR